MQCHSSRILLLVGRDDWQRDQHLNAMLLTRLGDYAIKVEWEDRAAEAIHWIRKQEEHFPWLPSSVKRASLRLAQLSYGLIHPSYLSYLHRRGSRSFEVRCQGLRARVAQLGDPSRIVVLARSAGGRIASLLADELGLAKVICLGYPFRRPGSPEDPARYRHLSTMRTPMLILQGTRDIYGGSGIEQQYPLSPSVQLQYLDTDHDFALGPEQVAHIVSCIEAAIDCNNSYSAHTHGDGRRCPQSARQRKSK